MRAENDFQVNLKAEREIEDLLHHFEYQNAILAALAEKLGVEFEDPNHSNSNAKNSAGR